MFNKKYWTVSPTNRVIGQAADRAAAKEPEAIIFDIQSFSIQDGPGIRTTVFMKGCPLRCIWCHNPESISGRPQLMINPALCVACGACVKACPNQAQQILAAGHQVNWERCNSLGLCVQVCAYNALNLVGQKYTPAKLWQRLAADWHYWELQAGGETGGVSFSGGEPMLQTTFIKHFVAQAPKPVHVAVQTSGYAPTSRFNELIDSVDLWLFDYKASGQQAHREMTGQDNSLILANLDHLCQLGQNIVLRLPIIPGLNDSDLHFQTIAELLHTYPQIRRAEIIGYHNLGESKQLRLGQPPACYQHPSASPDQKLAWLNRLASLGVTNAVLANG